jgi:hypothetical protein
MSHRCLWPGCNAIVLDHSWGCRGHWHRLPGNIRSWIGRAYRAGIDTDTHPTESYLKAHAAALAWILEYEQQHAAAKEARDAHNRVQ